MKKIPFILLLLLPLLSPAQSSYMGMGVEYNGSYRPGNTFGLGFHLDARLGSSKWYCTWNYAVGSNYNTDTYYRYSALLKLYKDPDWWTPSPHTKDPLAELIAMLVLPVACPTGVADYFYESPTRRLRMGMYANVFTADFWDITRTPVDAWSPEIGYRIFFNFKNNCSAYFSIGTSYCANTASYARANRFDGAHLNIEIGLTRRGVD